MEVNQPRELTLCDNRIKFIEHCHFLIHDFLKLSNSEINRGQIANEWCKLMTNWRNLSDILYRFSTSPTDRYAREMSSILILRNFLIRKLDHMLTLHINSVRK